MAADDHPAAAPVPEDLIEAARAGSSEALGKIIELCRPYLLLVANEELNSDLQAKFGASDLVQDTCLKASAEFAQFEGASRKDLLAWMRQILRNQLANLREHYQQTQKRQSGRELHQGDTSPAVLGMIQVDPSPTPARQAAANEQWLAIERALGQLPQHYARVVRWRYLESCSFPEIGARLGCSEEAARKLWVRALKELQPILERYR